MANNFENIEGAFGNSLRNKFDETSDYNLDLEIDAMLEAKKLHQYFSSSSLEKLNHRNLVVHTQSGADYCFQATTVRFKNLNGDFCDAEFSVPVNFEGPIRLWSEDLRGKKIWTTIDKIEYSNCNPTLLFNFLGKYTNRFTQDDVDDLPF